MAADRAALPFLKEMALHRLACPNCSTATKLTDHCGIGVRIVNTMEKTIKTAIREAVS